MMVARKIPLICVVGPTASGKTGLSIPLATALGAQIVAMDSMQVYRGMDIGTAKPDMAERRGVPHHMLDVASPSEPFSVSDYARMAGECIRDIHAAGDIPMLVGGTGFYLRALTEGLTLGGAKGDERLRGELGREAATEDGRRRLHACLERRDPETAKRLHYNDSRRVIRALEVMELTGVPFSRQAESAPPYDCPYELFMLGTDMERGALYERINARVDDMLSAGLEGEVRALLESGVPPEAQAMQGLGYKELVPVLRGDTDIREAAERIKRGTRHYAKRQLTWFRAEKRVNWLCMREPGVYDRAKRMCEAFLEGKR